MGYRPHHILDFQVKIGREVGDFENTLTFEEVSEALDKAKIHYSTQEDEHIIDYQSLMGFNTKTSTKSKDIQNTLEICRSLLLDAIMRKEMVSIGFGGFSV